VSSAAPPGYGTKEETAVAAQFPGAGYVASSTYRAALEADLARAVDGEVRFDDGARALYSTDSSNYRQVPIGVVIPRSLDDVEATFADCRDHGAPVLSRGGGTSLASPASRSST